jgi:hypothetical protein
VSVGVHLVRMLVYTTGGMTIGCHNRKWANQGAAANGLSAVRSCVAGVRERTVRSTAPAEAVAELGR